MAKSAVSVCCFYLVLLSTMLVQVDCKYQSLTVQGSKLTSRSNSMFLMKTAGTKVHKGRLMYRPSTAQGITPFTLEICAFHGPGFHQFYMSDKLTCEEKRRKSKYRETLNIDPSDGTEKVIDLDFGKFNIINDNNEMVYFILFD